SKTTEDWLVASCCVVRIIVTVGRFPTPMGKNLMLAAKIIKISAISNFCSTVLQGPRPQNLPRPPLSTPIKDSP
ncbi:hypothetical protein, partial [Pseudomonas chlororaphis]|uniref:hypothetical protein n=1 Tax=Pseudomonas chlororaphis TaxID=587753 RepID=UPI001B329B99